MARSLLPSPRSARRLLFGGVPTVSILSPPSPSLPFNLFARTGGVQHYQKELEDSQALAKRFREGHEVRDLLESLKRPVETTHQGFIDKVQVSIPRPEVGRPGLVGILKRSGSSSWSHARHVSFGDVNVREIENCLDHASFPPSPPPPPRQHRRPISILKRSGTMPGTYPRGVSFGGVTVRKIENCLVPPRPYPPPPHALFPGPRAVGGRHPLGSEGWQSVETPRQSHHKHFCEVTSRPALRGSVIGIAAAVIGVTLLFTGWACC